MTTPRSLSNKDADPTRLPLAAPALGVLSIHLDGQRCRVGCEYCYLGARTGSDGEADGSGRDSRDSLDTEVLGAALSRLDYAEIAVAVSEPAFRAVEPLRAIVAAARKRGRPVAVTTTASVLRDCPELVEGVARVSLSIDPRKGPTAPSWVARVAGSVRASGREVALIVSLVTERYAQALLDGELAALVELPEVDKVALHGLKPPPAWCDRAFWLRACARLAPLLARHLDRRLYLDCYVAARILGLGGCPARPDLSPGNEFRSCVYQSAPDFTFTTVDELAQRLDGFVAPAVCPFPIS